MRWEAAGGQFTNGRMAALKTDPIRAAISRFGDPFPPFDYGSDMGLRDIDREEAEALGLQSLGRSVVSRAPERVTPEEALAMIQGITDAVEDKAALHRCIADDAASVVGAHFETRNASRKHKPGWKPSGYWGDASEAVEGGAGGVRGVCEGEVEN